MRVKIKIKNKLEGKSNSLIGGLKYWKQKTNEQKDKKKMKTKSEKLIHHKLELHDKIENY